MRLRIAPEDSRQRRSLDRARGIAEWTFKIAGWIAALAGVEFGYTKTGSPLLGATSVVLCMALYVVFASSISSLYLERNDGSRMGSGKWPRLFSILRMVFAFAAVFLCVAISSELVKAFVAALAAPTPG
jgi:hypothetical protein